MSATPVDAVLSTGPTRRLRFTDTAGRPVAMAEPISHDGRAFRNTANPTGPSRPVRDVTGRLLTSLLSFGGAERFDLLLHPPAGVALRAHVDLLDWRTAKVLRTLVLPVVVV